MKEVINCESCGKEVERERSEINRSRKLGRKVYCSRSCTGRESPPAKNPSIENLWQGGRTGDDFSPFREYLRRARRRGKECTITVEELKEIWDRQKGVCLITGQPMFHPERGENHGSTASLDRIDSGLGYIPNNVRFICMWANIARRHEDDRELIAWCKMVTAHANRSLSETDLRGAFRNYD